MEQDNTKEMLVIGLKVLAGVAISTVWFFSVPFVLSMIFGFFSYTAKAGGTETDPAALMIISSLIGTVIACIVDLITHNLLKKLLNRSLWVYIVQSAHVYNFTLFGVIFGGDGSDPSAAALSIGIMIYLIGGVLLSAGVRKLISVIRKDDK
ncbi:MAG: hypothetical protein IJ007_07140 [Oscillospiraceae bacterium]|nr:hypothetical protein [Oscillospiraceae bacterium]